MSPKTPVVLLVLVETARLRWFVAALGLDGWPVPLLRSEEGDRHVRCNRHNRPLELSRLFGHDTRRKYGSFTMTYTRERNLNAI